MNKKLKLFIATTLALFAFPINIMAYSDKIIVSGQNVGIHIDTNGVMIIGFYKVNGEDINSNPSIEVGDLITKVEDTEVNSIEELTTAIEDNISNNEVHITLVRDEEIIESTITLKQVDGVYKTGLYVKDGVTGIGTLTYIDPNTKIFGILGHEITESSSQKLVEVREGTIFGSSITSIKKSTDGTAGEKIASFDYSDIIGTINENTTSGIFGVYETDIDDSNLYEVGQKEEVVLGDATILTVLNDNTVEEFTINITKINQTSATKNISFEITDERLLSATGGIVQGMSGSPILQNGKIIGAVTHVVLDNVETGYGIFITTMLEEGEN